MSSIPHRIRNLLDSGRGEVRQLEHEYHIWLVITIFSITSCVFLFLSSLLLFDVETPSTLLLPRLLIGGNDIFFEVKEDGIKLGDLRVSQGNLHWVPSGNVYGYTLEWNQLTEVTREFGRREKYIY